MAQPDFRVWVQDLHAPCVMVAASPAAEQLCVSRNGLRIVDMLRPVSRLSQLRGAVSNHIDMGQEVFEGSFEALTFHSLYLGLFS